MTSDKPPSRQELNARIKRYQDALDRAGDFVKHEDKQRIRDRIEELKKQS